ncbi:hypothetical protein F5Y04DRAFT_263425 [Hypomontagnella monticulosa]|nr:hypothetical protein F5Y04DRAFT_263425 [Hypomontagnella monticulosa]
MNLSDTSIASLTQKCVKAFKICLTLSELMDDRWAENRFADFNLWVDGVGALAAPRASLDYRFESKPMELTLVKSLLVMLNDFLEKCAHYARTGESTSADEAIENVDSALGNLALIAVAIRRTGKRSRLQKADSKFKPDDHTELETFLRFVILYRRFRKGSSFEACEDALGVPTLSPPQKRLIEANLRRRNRFIQAQRHSELLRTGNIFLDDAVSQLAIGPSTAQLESKRTPVDKGKAPQRSVPRDAPTISGTSASVPESAFRIHPREKMAVRPAMTAITILTSAIQYPNPPKPRPDHQLFKCPCCCQSLPMDVAIETTLWKKHLSEDLHPYTCIVEDCPKPSTMYVTKHDWEEHVKSEHSPRRVCPLCEDTPIIYLSVGDFMDHIRQEHPETASDGFLATLLSSSSVITIGTDHCPLCDSTGPESSPEFISHVLECIHNFSLTSLPWADQPDLDPKSIGTFNPESVKNRDMFQWLDSVSSDDSMGLQLSGFDIIHSGGTTAANTYFERNDYFHEGLELDSLSVKERSFSTSSLVSASNLKSVSSMESFWSIPSSNPEQVDTAEPGSILRQCERAQALRTFSRKTMERCFEDILGQTPEASYLYATYLGATANLLDEMHPPLVLGSPSDGSDLAAAERRRRRRTERSAMAKLTDYLNKDTDVSDDPGEDMSAAERRRRRRMERSAMARLEDYLDKDTDVWEGMSAAEFSRQERAIEDLLLPSKTEKTELPRRGLMETLKRNFKGVSKASPESRHKDVIPEQTPSREFIRIRPEDNDEPFIPEKKS